MRKGMIMMTHENKKKFWFFYVKEANEESNAYELYAFTDSKNIAEEFMRTRCMSKFYKKIVKVDRLNYNHLIKNHMMCELEYHEGVCRTNSNKFCTYKLPVTKYENRRIMADESIFLHETLYTYVWYDINFLKKKYIEALWTLGYTMLNSYVKYGQNLIHDKIEDNMIPNDMNFLLNVCGWTYISEKRDLN